jgi:hypothetical protein
MGLVKLGREPLHSLAMAAELPGAGPPELPLSVELLLGRLIRTIDTTHGAELLQGVPHPFALPEPAPHLPGRGFRPAWIVINRLLVPDQGLHHLFALE